MLEFLGSGVLGSIFGGLFRLAPEVLKWLDKKNERSHELNMFDRQCNLELQRGTFRMDEKYVDHGIEQMDAITAAFKQQSSDAKASYKWVSALSALVRPMITYCLFGLYVAIKITAIVHAIHSGAPWYQVLPNHWTGEDFAMLSMILTFHFVGRPIEKYSR